MNAIETAADLFAINAEIKRLTDLADALKATLKANGSFEDGGYSVSIKTSDRTTVDTKALKEAYPEIAAECSRTTSVTSVTVKKI